MNESASSDGAVPNDAVHDEINHIIFQYGPANEIARGAAPVLTDDGFRQAWRSVFRVHRMAAESVTGLMSDWTPTATDEAFIARNFPNLLERTAVSQRPEPDGWGEAIAQARLVREAAARQLQQEAVDRQLQDMRKDIAEISERVSIPLLRTASEPPPFLASRALIPDELYVVVAGVAPTARGTLNMKWVMENELARDGVTFEDVLADAAASLGGGLRLVARDDGIEDSDGWILHVEGVDDVYMPAGAVALPDFAERMSDVFGGGDRFVAGFPCEDHLFVAPADTPSAAKVSELVSEPHECGSDVTPTVLLLEPGGMRVIEQIPR